MADIRFYVVIPKNFDEEDFEWGTAAASTNNLLGFRMYIFYYVVEYVHPGSLRTAIQSLSSIQELLKKNVTMSVRRELETIAPTSFWDHTRNIRSGCTPCRSIFAEKTTKLGLKSNRAEWHVHTIGVDSGSLTSWRTVPCYRPECECITIALHKTDYDD